MFQCDLFRVFFAIQKYRWEGSSYESAGESLYEQGLPRM